MFVKGYSDFSLSRAGIMSSYIPGSSWGAYFKLDNDVRQLFPYINAVVKKARFYDNPEHVQFIMDGFQCTLYPDDVIAAPFTDQAHALVFAKRVIDFVNDLHSRKAFLQPDHKKFRPVSVMDVYKLLPQTNCKACGFPTCLAFAGAMSNGEAIPDQCPGFARPICENAMYPVYDKHGNLVSTVVIETDIAISRPDRHDQQRHIEILERKLAEERQKNKALLKSPSVKVHQENNAVEARANLTDREIQVLCLVAEGATNTAISESLFISPHTVKSHIVHIFNKLGVNDGTQAAVWAVRHKII